MSKVLALYQRVSSTALGKWLFSRALCSKAPYFKTIRPTITHLGPNRCEALMADRRAVRNHIGSVHAIAMCNLAELVGGLMTDVTIPASMRWIPKGMSVSYVKVAHGQLKAVATPEIPITEANQAYELPVKVDVTNAEGDIVFTARITMWVAPKSKP